MLPTWPFGVIMVTGRSHTSVDVACSVAMHAKELSTARKIET